MTTSQEIRLLMRYFDAPQRENHTKLHTYEKSSFPEPVSTDTVICQYVCNCVFPCGLLSVDGGVSNVSISSSSAALVAPNKFFKLNRLAPLAGLTLSYVNGIGKEKGNVWEPRLRSTAVEDGALDDWNRPFDKRMEKGSP